MNIIIAAIFIFIINLQANASTKTNVNIVTNEFDLIENRKVMEEEIKQLRESATQTIGQGAMAELFNPARNQ
jgi:hypothetical protein